MRNISVSIPILILAILSLLSIGGCNGDNILSTPIPDAILEVMQRPRYSDATWCLRVIDFETGEVIYDLNPNLLAFTGSVRKTYSVGLALNELGADHTFKTPVYGQGDVDGSGVLAGDLILVAAGDLTMGGRNTPQGTVAFTSFDHTEANSLGSAILTEPNPLLGIDELAAQVAASGIKTVEGDVVVDDRLFDLFRVPNGNVLITPMIINDNLVDVTIIPTEPGQPAMVDWRPKSAAFEVESNVITSAEGTELDITLTGDIPGCIGSPGCKGTVEGQIPAGFKPALPGVETLVQTFRIEDPASYARIVFIEALEKAGVEVTADTIAPNPAGKLPPRDSYSEDSKVAEFVSLPYSEYSKLILKVSHNLGANLSLMLFGLTQGVRTIDDALAAERETLINDFGIKGSDFNFPTNGSGSPDSQASPSATVKLLKEMGDREVFPSYFDSFPILGVDGSLAAVGVDPPNPVIAPAIGKVFAKTGTTILEGFFKAQVFAGYIDAKSGRRLVYALYVNDIGPLRSRFSATRARYQPLSMTRISKRRAG
jgi:D-alanyl-D-alanine carboxypeptidase/D-alanyl-D-alanine-endopeptidase (penicillin-binding protein 4)